jgi:hypothetical protein
MDIIFSGFSFIQKTSVWILRLALIAGIGACLFNFTKNPFAVSMIIIVSFIILSILCEEKIIVYDDRLIYRKKYLLNFYIIDKIFYLKNIEKLEASTNTIIDQIVISIGHLWGGYLWVYLTDGSHKTIQTSINRTVLIEIADIVNTAIMLNKEN